MYFQINQTLCQFLLSCLVPAFVLTFFLKGFITVYPQSFSNLPDMSLKLLSVFNILRGYLCMNLCMQLAFES